MTESRHRCALVFLMMLIAGLAYSRSYNDTASFEVEAGTWDQFVLSLQWPFTACKNMRCTSSFEERWTIHGLWPGYSGKKDCPTGCPNVPFDKNNVKSIPGIKTYWPDLKSRDPTSFWNYEWEKHGRCALQASKVRSCKDYFNRAVTTRRKYSPGSALENQGIKPSNSKSVKTKTVSDALKKAFKNKTVLLQCLLKGGKYYLAEVHLCFDRSLLLKSCRKPQCGSGTYIACPSSGVLYYPRTVRT